MTKIPQNPLILIDGTSYLYRAYYAFPLLTNSSGEHVSVIYGVINMLKRLLRSYQSDHVAIVFDPQGKTFRNRLYKYYKSNRSPMPSDLCKQIKPIYEIIRTMGIPLIVINDIEADDIIGTIALEASNNNHNVLISTSDKDMAQIVSSKIILIDTMSNKIFGPKEIQVKFGVMPNLIIDYLALTGDSADNIPGVPGIGKKTAQKLLCKLGNLESIYRQLNNINILNFHGAKTIILRLKQHREIAFFYKKLITIRTDINIKIAYNQLAIQTINIKKLNNLFQRYEFKNWIKILKTENWLKVSNKTTPSKLSFSINKFFEALNKTKKSNF